MDFIFQDKNIIKNSNKVPLNELVMEIKKSRKLRKIPQDKKIEEIKDNLHKYFDISVEKVPALDASWIQKKRSYHKYQPYYSEVSEKENVTFLPKNKLHLESLKFLLECSYHQFWCHLIYEPRALAMLDSFILSSLGWYEVKHLQGDYLSIYSEIYDCMARILLRMFHFKQSEEEYMAEETVLKHLNESEFFTLSKTIQLCLLYNHSNNALVFKIVDSFFNKKHKSKFNKDLKKVIEHALLVFEMVGGHLCGFDENSSAIPFILRPKPLHFDPFWLEEVVTYLLDTAASLHAFLSNCKPAVEMALKMGVPYRLAYFHNRVYEKLYKIMKIKGSVPYDWSRLQQRIYDHIALGRSEFIKVFHIFVTYLIDKIMDSQGNIEVQSEFVEQYLKLITSALEDDFFIFDYQNSNEIDLQFQVLSEFCPELDYMRISYILECLNTIPKLEGASTKKIEKQTSVIKQPTPGTSGASNGLPKKQAQKKEPDEKGIESLIQSVLDTLPHLGDGFILKCLEIYNYDPYEVISAVLDENISPALIDVPQDLIRIPPEPQPEQPILAYKGKKPEYKDATQLLNDKSDMENIKSYVLKSSNISYDMYDDEFDDRYEEEPKLHFYERTEEPDLYKYMENRFEGYDLVSDPSSSDDDNASSTVNGAPSKDNNKSRAFCEDPAVVRARREAQRGQHPGSSRKTDLVGKPKGQGQDKNVVNNRNHKNANKSSKANHSRKSGAQWKRNKGMFPS